VQALYGNRSGLCLETQHFLIHRITRIPLDELKAGERYQQC